MGMCLQCVVSWLVLILGTYFCFFTGWLYLWLLFFAVFLLIRWLGPNRIPASQPGSLGCLFGVLGQLLMPVWFVLLCLGMLKVTVFSLDASEAVYALNMTLLLTAVYGVFMLGDVVRIRRTQKKPAPGCCASCGYNLTGNVSGRCPECGVPAIKEDNESNDTTRHSPVC
jgi:predicted RNA-binding Zn-ribbon protein involved in translation (DUF1610 family)